MGLADRFLVGIETCNVGLREVFGDGDTHTARAATDIESTSAVFQASNHTGHRLEPIARKAVFILAAVD
jgi:hypothetical protein